MSYQNDTEGLYGSAQAREQMLQMRICTVLSRINADKRNLKQMIAAQCAGADGQQAIKAAAAAAKAGADKTKGMKASKGRSSYVPEEVLANVPDPGAQGCAIWIQAIADISL